MSPSVANGGDINNLIARPTTCLKSGKLLFSEAEAAQMLKSLFYSAGGDESKAKYKRRVEQ